MFGFINLTYLILKLNNAGLIKLIYSQRCNVKCPSLNVLIPCYVIKKPPKQAWVVNTQPFGWVEVPKCRINPLGSEHYTRAHYRRYRGTPGRH
jgi:hypothetical protein